MNDKKRSIVIICLCILAVMTRFFGIEYQSLWFDEGATYAFSQQSLDQLFASDEPNSPIYYWMEGLFLGAFGKSEFAIRFTSAVAGTILVFVSFFVTEKMFGNWKYAAVVSSLILLSGYNIAYSQEARGFEIIAMLFLVQLYLLLCALEDKKQFGGLHWV